ncbi:MAG: hypothetical protein ACRCYU_10740 [Nocardioides sp.]
MTNTHNMTTHDNTGTHSNEGSRTAAEEVAALFATAGAEADAISRLAGCVEQLQRAQAAKRVLAGLSPAELRAALEFRWPECGDLR